MRSMIDTLQVLLTIAAIGAAILFSVNASRLGSSLRVSDTDATAILQAEGLTQTTIRMSPERD